MQLFANNAISALAGAVSNVAVTMSVQPGHGAKFPAPVGGDYFLVTLFDLVAGIESNHEIVKCTARSVDTLTIVRAQEGTAARAFGAGAQVSGRLTAGTLARLAQTDMPTTFTQPVTILTAAAGNNTTQAASTAFVTAAVNVAIAALVASSPAALDTLNELAIALGNDANFATTTAASLGNRLRVDTAAQNLTAPQKVNALTNLGIEQINNTSDANKPVSTATTTALNLKANIASPVFTGNVGVVVAPSAWTGGTNALQGDGGALWFRGAASGFHSMANSYFDGASYKYVGTGFASQYMQQSGIHSWFTAASGAANAAITFTEAMRISAAGNLLIGTATDNGTDKLQVNGNTLVAGILTLAGPAVSGSAGKWQNSGRGVGFLYSDGGGAGVADMSSGIGNGIYWNTTGGYVTFQTVGTEKLRVTTAGNVLIGTTTDDGVNRLQVNGGGRFSNGGSGSLILTHNFSFGASNFALKLEGDSGSSGGYLTQYTNVGGFQLAQGGTYYGGGPTRTDANSTSFAAITGTSGALVFYTNSGLTANTNFTPAERMRITATGNLLINTTTDNTRDKLQVAGSMSAGRAGLLLTIADNGGSDFGNDIFVPYDGGGSTQKAFRIRTSYSSGVGMFSISRSTNSAAQLTNPATLAYSDCLNIAGSGNLLIGTATDDGTNKLQVAGSAAISGTVTAATVTQTSDERKKCNWRPLADEQLDALAGMELAGIFDWRDGSGSSCGGSAQQIRDIVPEAVHEDAEGNLTVNYGGLGFAIQQAALRRLWSKP